MEKKIFRAKVRFKADGGDAEKGQVEAVFATMNVIDLDEDVTTTGAFGTQDGVLMEPWNHDWKLPVGKGIVEERGNEALFTGQYFLNTQAGREHYEVAKALAEAQEWSYTFHIKKRSEGEFEGRQVRFLEKLDVIGVSQVDRGAGINTRTTAVKSKDGDGDGEGEGAEETPSEPSGVSVAVVQTQIQILELEV